MTDVDRASSENVALRYFPVVGRAQPLRHALADAGIAFADERIPPAEWPAHKKHSDVAGPFGALPTLAWGGVVVSETLPVAAFLARKLQHCRDLDDATIAAHEAICSACHLDVTVRFGEIIWADFVYPGADMARAIGPLMARVMGKLERIDAVVAPMWLGGDRPVMADFFAAEAFETIRYALGPERESVLARRFPRLCDLATRARARPTLAVSWQIRPDRFTARPEEPAVLAALRASDLSLAGL
jgi:glutathione S-transferase